APPPAAPVPPPGPFAEAAPPAWAPAPPGAPVATLPSPHGYDAPAPGWPGPFPAPATAGAAKRGPSAFLKVVGVVALLAVLAAGGREFYRMAVETSGAAGTGKRAAAPVKPRPVRLTAPARVAGMPRLTTAEAKEYERAVKNAAPGRQPLGASYGVGGRTHFDLIALTAEAKGSARSTLRMFMEPRTKRFDAKFSAGQSLPGGTECTRMTINQHVAAVCAWSTPRSQGVVTWFSGSDVRALAKVATQVRADVEGS
ncbi:MAG TPA: hypothetical protein VNA14_10960, partial [Mycobacteriales bacterium]|nr:hypothetical protein [Mycobacteriales bacterium]